MRWLKKNLSTILLGFAFILGLALVLYPSVSDYWNSFHQSRAIMQYATDVANLNSSEYDRFFESAYSYNRLIASQGIHWRLTDEEREVYHEELNYTGSGIMGYISIEKIHVMLPLYHGTSDAVLQTSVGHLEGSSLPVGTGSWNSYAARTGSGVTDPNDGAHCSLSGHRGLPSAKLFTDLDRLVLGDVFTINILDKTLTYEVDQIRVVEPTNLSDLVLEPGKDYCTLITCTPYGINTHRLLVRGHRVNNIQGDVRVVADALQIEPIYIAPLLAVPILILLVIVTVILTDREKRHRAAHNRRTDWL